MKSKTKRKYMKTSLNAEHVVGSRSLNKVVVVVVVAHVKPRKIGKWGLVGR